MKVLIADDHPLFVEGLKSLLTAHGISVVGTAHDGLEAIEKARVTRPDLILMDIQMPRVDGLAALRLIKAEMPEIKIVMLTMSGEEDDLTEAIRCGACGYALKTQDTAEFFALFEDIARGEVVLSATFAARVLEELRGHSPERLSEASLSARERDVLSLVAQGLTYKEVGARLFIAERTVKYHMAQLIERLHVANRSQALGYAKRAGLVK